MKTSTVLKRALRLLDGGRRWIQGKMYGSKPGVRGRCFCSWGAISRAAMNTNVRSLEADEYLCRAVSGNSVLFNDAPHRRWPHVEAAFKRAIKAAEADERR